MSTLGTPKETEMAEHHRINGQKRWAGKTPEERVAGTQVARDAHRGVAAIAKQVDQLGVDVLTELRALRAEVSELRERVAA
jgi:uncharacterized membrane protein